jgi:ATP:ADP antiporter, AAA family
MPKETQSEFGRLRGFLWPVHGYEMRKLLPMFIMFFFISFNYNALRNLKDAIVVTQEFSGAEIIPFIKVWVMLPMSVLMIYIFTRLSHWLTSEHIFYFIVTMFLVYFLFFTFVVYPRGEALTLNSTAEYLQTILPKGLRGFIAMIRYWHFTMFYVMAELWSNIILSVLFWAFANEITKIGEAKRFYGILGLGANLASIAAGRVSLSVCKLKYIPTFYGSDAWEQTLVVMISVVTVVGIITMILYRWMHEKILTDPSLYEHSESVSAQRARKPKMTMRENFGCLIQSKYIFCIAFIVVVYNSIINLVEVVWKYYVNQMYPDPSDFSAYMNQVTIWTGVFAFVISILITGNSLRRLGWTITALITPLIILITSIGFFSFTFFYDHFAGLIVGLQPLAVIVFFGAMQNCLSRASKYTVFDATKELAFIPLSKKTRLRAKTSIDGVGSRLGKSSGSIIYQILLLTFASLPACVGYIGGILFFLLGGWIFAVKSLGSKFNKKTQDAEKPNVVK